MKCQCHTLGCGDENHRGEAGPIMCSRDAVRTFHYKVPFRYDRRNLVERSVELCEPCARWHESHKGIWE